MELRMGTRLPSQGRRWRHAKGRSTVGHSHLMALAVRDIVGFLGSKAGGGQEGAFSMRSELGCHVPTPAGTASLPHSLSKKPNQNAGGAIWYKYGG